jgi:hypothetical protein
MSTAYLDHLEHIADRIHHDHKATNLYLWTGDMADIDQARIDLWAAWAKGGTVQPNTTPPTTPANMHPDPRCVDRRWQTIDPLNWTKPEASGQNAKR